MKNIVLVHGSYGRPYENWFPWLESKLSEKGIRCTVPTFPSPEHQKFADWAKLLDYYEEMGYIDRDTILIGHSCGSIFLVRYLFERPKLKVSCLITVSGYNGFISGDTRMDVLNKDFYTESSLKGLECNVGQIHSFYSKNDPFIPISHLEDFARKLGGREHVIENAGHFNSAAGFDAFPELLDLIDNISSCVATERDDKT